MRLFAKKNGEHNVAPEYNVSKRNTRNNKRVREREKKFNVVRKEYI